MALDPYELERRARAILRETNGRPTDDQVREAVVLSRGAIMAEEARHQGQPTPCEGCGTTEREVEHSDLLGVTLCGRCYETRAQGDADLHTGGAAHVERAGPFALPLDEFVAAKSQVPPALIGDADDNLLPALGLILIVAKGGKGKTTLIIEQAFHLASGIEWLGFEVPRPLRVLFIENEGPREPFRHKVELKRQHWPHPITGGIYIYDQDWGQARLNVGAFVERLNGFCADNEIDLIIGDPLDTFGMEGVGSPEDTRNMVERFQKAGLGSTVAWEVLTHSRKESVADAVDAVSGAWGGKPDSLLVLEKQQGNRARLSFSKVRWSRRGERGAYILAFDPDSESFDLVHEEATEERDLVAEMEALLTKRPHLTAKDIADKDDGIGANVDRIKRELNDNPDRFAARTGDEAKAVGRHFNATVWSVTRTPESHESHPVSQGDGLGGVSLTPPYRESDHTQTTPALLDQSDSDSEPPESHPTRNLSRDEA